MNVQLRPKDTQLYRAPPGYALKRGTRPRSADGRPGRGGEPQLQVQQQDHQQQQQEDQQPQQQQVRSQVRGQRQEKIQVQNQRQVQSQRQSRAQGQVYEQGEGQVQWQEGQAEPIDMELLSKVISSSRLKGLKMKQYVMETFMRKLFQSMKQLRDIEAAKGKSIAIDKQRKLKLARMIQILTLQRRNLQAQTETLQKGIILLSRKHVNVKKHADCLMKEIHVLRKENTKLRGELDFKVIQIDSLVQNKNDLQRQLDGHTNLRIQSDNIQFETKRLRIENENLKEAVQQLESLLRTKVQEREELELKNAHINQELERKDADDANIRIRCERLAAENHTLRQELAQHQANRTDAQLVCAEADRVRERVTQLQRECLRLQRMYMMEADTRKSLHNQLQEVKGNLRVLCRCRPCVADDQNLIQFNSLDRVTVPCSMRCNSASYQKSVTFDQLGGYIPNEETFTFNRVFRPSASQLDVFEEIRPLVASCVDGYNVCIMAYGPTGSGKTFTMQGTPRDQGVGMRAVTELFELVQPLQGIWEIKVCLAMLEIHNETIYDLLGEQIKPVKLSDDGVDVRLIDAEEKIANNEQDILYWISKGHKRRKVTATKLNMESSRSHHIIRLQLVLHSLVDRSSRSSSLILCDLAGSESAERIEASGEVHIETGFINKSLVTLARVFEALRKRNVHYPIGVFQTPVPAPYRDSKLTHLLKPCLGGQAKCVLIITVCGETTSIDRSLKALEFGQQAMQISLGPAKPNERILTNWNSKRRAKSMEPSTISS